MSGARAFAEVTDLLAGPAIGKAFRKDEAHFLDGAATQLVICDMSGTGSGYGR
jgi:hypothetical protein